MSAFYNSKKNVLNRWKRQGSQSYISPKEKRGMMHDLPRYVSPHKQPEDTTNMMNRGMYQNGEGLLPPGKLQDEGMGIMNGENNILLDPLSGERIKTTLTMDIFEFKLRPVLSIPPDVNPEDKLPELVEYNKTRQKGDDFTKAFAELRDTHRPETLPEFARPQKGEGDEDDQQQDEEGGPPVSSKFDRGLVRLFFFFS